MPTTRYTACELADIQCPALIKALLGPWVVDQRPPRACREQAELDARREEQLRADLAMAQLEKHGMCALRGFPELASVCDSEDFMIKRAPWPAQRARAAERAGDALHLYLAAMTSCVPSMSVLHALQWLRAGNGRCVCQGQCSQAQRSDAGIWGRAGDDKHIRLHCSAGCATAFHNPICWRAFERELKQQDHTFNLKVGPWRTGWRALELRPRAERRRLPVHSPAPAAAAWQEA